MMKPIEILNIASLVNALGFRSVATQNMQPEEAEALVSKLGIHGLSFLEILHETPSYKAFKDDGIVCGETGHVSNMTSYDVEEDLNKDDVL